jgi:DNA/RNA endonuclease YhcR with UshA esterase domain
MKKAFLLLSLTWFFNGLPISTFGQNLPTYTIAQVRGEDGFEGGGADSNNVKCKLTGVVYGRNFGATGNRVQFTLIDETGGIGLFKNVNDLPIQLQEGDSIRAIGTVNHFNGLSQMILDSVFRFASDRPLKTPVLVNALSENTESELVKLEGFQLVNPASWPASPTGSGFTVKIRKGATELDLRIDNDCDLFGAPAPNGYLNIVGIGGQFDNSIPRNSGYQLLPRSAADITPGLPPVKPAIGFQNASLTLSENAGNVLIALSISPLPASQTVALIIGKDSNTIQNTDYQIQSPPLITFPAGGPGTQFISLIIPQNTQTNPLRKFSLVIRRLSGDTTYVISADSVLKVTLNDDDVAQPQLPTYPIGLLRGSNQIEGGVADSLGIRCKISGTLYGPNLRASNNGIQFTIRDQTGGIALFSASQNFGLNLTEGDSVRAIGQISQFNGLSQMVLDSLVKLASNRPLKQPETVDSLSESTESDLIRLENFNMVDPAQWTTGQGTGFTFQITNGQRTIDVRIDNDIDLFNQPVPVNTNFIFVQGLGGQFDSSIPRTSGYQILPRKMGDIAFENAVSGIVKEDFTVYPNPSSGRVSARLPLARRSEKARLVIYNAMGKTITDKISDANTLENEIEYALQNAVAGFYHLVFQQAEKQIVLKHLRLQGPE